MMIARITLAYPLRGSEIHVWIFDASLGRRLSFVKGNLSEKKKSKTKGTQSAEPRKIPNQIKIENVGEFFWFYQKIKISLDKIH